jgi:hypothetical protein
MPLHVEENPIVNRSPQMPDRSINHLANITTEPAPQEKGPDAEEIKAAEKAVAMGQVTDPEQAAKASAADRDRGGASS